MTLSERIEQDAEGSRELDAEIAVAVCGFITRPNRAYPEKTDYGYINDDGSEVWPGHGGKQLVPAFTTSLDAAMTLVPEGKNWEVFSYGHAQVLNTWVSPCIAGAATPTLALCAAALKARGL